MGKMSELDAALNALLEYSEVIRETVRGIRALMSFDEAPDPEDTAQAEVTEHVRELAEEAKPVMSEKVYTLEDVRALLKAKADQGYRSEVKALLKAHGAERLPDIDPAEYPAMMKESEEIGA